MIVVNGQTHFTYDSIIHYNCILLEFRCCFDLIVCGVSVNNNRDEWNDETVHDGGMNDMILGTDE
jgi:hypothetical protein